MIIYYQSKKTKDLVIRTNEAAKGVRTLAKCNLVYQFTCPCPDGCICPHGKSSYIGHTTCTLSRRLSYHLQNGAIKDHLANCHGRKITREEIVKNTEVRYFESDRFRLKILEALIINIEQPSINLQETGHNRILRLF